LLQSLGVDSPDWRDLALVLLLMLSALALAAAVWAWLDKRRIDPWVRLHGRIRASLARLGVATQPQDAPRALAARVRQTLGAEAEPLAQTLDALDQLRYGPEGRHVPGPQWLQGFNQRCQAWRRQQRGAVASRLGASAADN
jgi:hypothetical protein